jgi:mannose-1-phosphate guanylyltransferase
MAGGIGSRFWPFSRTKRPKQFLDILGVGKTLLQMTYERFSRFIPKENIYIVSNQQYENIILEQLNGITKNQILSEPCMRNTAPCIAYASFKIQKANPNANIIVTPSDHLVLKEDVFIDIAIKGLNFIKNKDALITLGITPTHPETGYGYIQAQSGETENNIFKKVKTFTEKPDIKMAKLFLESGDFFWNSGIFIWSLTSIMDALKEHTPDIYLLFKEGIDSYNTANEHSFIEKTYKECTPISIDYAVMEKADNVYMIPSSFGWSDLGTWSALYNHMDKDENNNAINGNVMTYDTNNCIIKMPDEKLVVINGLNDQIVVERDNILLICKKDDEQKIKVFLEDVKAKKGNEYI